MASKDQKYVREYIKRALQLSRVAEGESSKAARDLSTLHGRVMQRIEETYPTINKVKLKTLNKEVARLLIDDYEDGIVQKVDDTISELASREANWISETVKIYDDSYASKLVNSSTIVKSASAKTYQGHTFNFWFKTSGSKAHKRVMSILEDGYVRGVATQEITPMIEAVLNKSRRDVQTLVRSYFNHVGAEARDQQYQANADIIEGYYWNSVLDNRTTPLLCGIRDGRFYDRDRKPVGHSIPWDAGPGRLHFNCRSSSMAKILGSGDFRRFLQRPAISSGKDYERGDNTTRTGRVRKADKRARDAGIYKVSQVSGEFDYERWLKTNKTSFIADALGSKDLAEQFKKGSLSLVDIAKYNGGLNVLDL